MSQMPSGVLKAILKETAKAGLGGDTHLAHVTPGDTIISKERQAREPKFQALLRSALGKDYNKFTVGAKGAQKNPTTGLHAFDDAEGGAEGGISDHGGSDTSNGAGGGDGNSGNGPGNGGFGDASNNPEIGAGGVGNATEPGVAAANGAGGPGGFGTASDNPEIGRGASIAGGGPNAGVNSAQDAHTNQGVLGQIGDFLAGLVPGVTPGALDYDQKTGTFSTGLALDPGKALAGLADFGLGFAPGLGLVELGSRIGTGGGLAANALELGRTGGLLGGGLLGLGAPAAGSSLDSGANRSTPFGGTDFSVSGGSVAPAGPGTSGGFPSGPGISSIGSGGAAAIAGPGAGLSAQQAPPSSISSGTGNANLSGPSVQNSIFDFEQVADQLRI